MNDILFYFISFFMLICSFGVLLHSNPLFSALFLSLTMMGVAALFFLLKAYFMAGVQLTVYAGAVMVLFVMIMMLFDLKKKEKIKKDAKLFFKLFFSSWFCCLLIVAGFMSSELISSKRSDAFLEENTTKILAQLLVTDYIVAFEVLGILLLLIAVGAVAISRVDKEEKL